MKTQLLEDIGQSATLSLVPSKLAGDSTAEKQVQSIAPDPFPAPPTPRSAFGVWRQKPVADPGLPDGQQSDQELTPLNLSSVYDEIAALEAQYAAQPPQSEAGVMMPTEMLHEFAASGAESLHQSATPSAEPTFSLPPVQAEREPPDPLFDFTPTPPTPYVSEPFTPFETEVKPTKHRYLLWGACVLAGALLILGGRWLYQERSDAGVLALIAQEAKEEPPVDKAVQRRVAAAKEFTLGPDGAVQAPAVAPVPASPVPAAVPPLVLLEPAPPAAAKIQPSSEPDVASLAPEPAPKLESVAEQVRRPSLPKPRALKSERPVKAAVEPTTMKREREPGRQPAVAPAIAADKAAPRETAAAATLKACKEHGYQAEQCAKQACSMTKYGFVCRGK